MLLSLSVAREKVHKIIIADMLLCMRTTIDINDELLIKAKSYALNERKTFGAVVEQALRLFLASPVGPDAVDVPALPVFRGRGVQPGVDLMDNAALEEFMDAET